LAAFRLREKSEDPDPGQQWQTIYCALMLLVMVFFVMIASWSTVEARKMSYARNIAGKAAQNENDARDVMRRYAARPEMQGILTLEGTAGGFKAVVQTPVLFASGKADVQAQALLADIARMARETSLFITIEGHTDSTPINTADFPSNWELSTMRAVNVLRVLLAQGVPADRLSAVGYGEQRPVARNETEAGRVKNRRIEIIFSRPGA
jgi:chemotaxis protein MotB